VTNVQKMGTDPEDDIESKCQDAYCDGFEDASSGNSNYNPYDPNDQRRMYDAYEKGYFEGGEIQPDDDP